MGKMKAIVSVINQKKTLLIKLKLQEGVVKSLGDILAKIDDRESYFAYYNEKTGDSDYSIKLRHLKGITIPFFSEEETGFAIFKDKSMEVLLLKDSSLFKKVEKSIFGVFDFVSVKKKN